MGWWLPPEYLDMMGVSHAEVYGSGFLGIRYCHACACSQKATADEVCWNCGGVLDGARPSYWPNTASGETVKGGRSYSPWELEVSEDVVAAILEGFQTGGMGDDAVIPQGILAQ